MAGRKPTRAQYAEQLERLRAENSQLLAMLELAPAVVLLSQGPEHTFSFVNAQARAHMRGREILGRTFRDALPCLADQLSHEVFDRVFGSGVPIKRVDVPIPFETTEQPPVEALFDCVHLPLTDQQGNVLGVAALAIDVTERHQARRRVAMLGNQLTDDAQTIAELTEELSALRYSCLETQVAHNNVLAETCSRLEDARRLVAHLKQEVVERSSELTEERALASRLVELAPAGIAYLDEDQVFRWVNPRFLELFRMPREAFEGRTISEAFPAARSYFAPMLVSVLERGKPDFAEAVPFVFGNEGAERKTFWDIAYHPVAATAGMKAGVLFFALDVTARVENEQLQRVQIAALKQADAVRDEMLSVVSHELRTPIHVLLGYGTILHRKIGGQLTSVQRGYLRKMLGAAQIMADLVNDTLDLSQLKAGTLTLEPREFNFTDVLDHAIAAYEPALLSKGLRLDTRKTQTDATLFADEQRIFQVLAKLLDNAIKFTPEGGQISVRVVSHPDRLVCEIEDTGIGIAEEVQKRLFEPSSIVKNRPVPMTGGCGMGLTLGKAYAEAHGGRIEVNSTQGEGTLMRLTLPAVWLC
jgi:signal transduction histidine kinase